MARPLQPLPGPDRGQAGAARIPKAARSIVAEPLPDHALAQRPKRVGVLFVLCVAGHATTSIRNVIDTRDMTILTIASAHLSSVSTHGRPYRGGCALRHRFIACSRRNARGNLRRQMAHQFGSYDARMHGRRANASWTQPTIETQRTKRVGGFGAAIGQPRLVFRAFKIWIVKIDVAYVMRPRRKNDHPGVFFEQGRQAIDEDKMPQMIRAKLRLEAVLGFPLRASHDAGVTDNEIEWEF